MQRHAAWCSIVLVLLVTQEASAQRTINPTGGTNASDGLRIEVLPSAAFQLYRSGARQLYAPEGIWLAVGTSVTSARGPRA
jgi:hypothetical protein